RGTEARRAGVPCPARTRRTRVVRVGPCDGPALVGRGSRGPPAVPPAGSADLLIRGLAVLRGRLLVFLLVGERVEVLAAQLPRVVHRPDDEERLLLPPRGAEGAAPRRRADLRVHRS